MLSHLRLLHIELAFTNRASVTILSHGVIAMRRKGITWLIIVGALFLAGCNRIPSALFSVDHLDGRSPLTVMFDGALSNDPDGEIVAYEWDFGDGTYASEAQVTHTFSTDTDCNFKVRLTVTDDQGATNSHTATIHVRGANTPPEPGEVLFFDDFEDGDADWVSTTSGWGTDNGEYVLYVGIMQPATQYTFVLDGKNWSNYMIDADVWISGGARAIGFIFYAQENLNSYVIAWGSTGKIWWEVYSNGDKIYESDPVEPGLFANDQQHIEVTASGNTYSYIVNGLTRSTFENTYYTTGMPGLAGYNGTPMMWPYPFGVDNFRVTALQ